MNFMDIWVGFCLGYIFHSILEWWMRKAQKDEHKEEP
jgi:hypothetical protein